MADISSISPEQLADYREMFNLMDSDRSGTVSASELGQAMTKLGRPMDAADLENALAAVDKDRSGELDFTEFVRFMSTTSAGGEDVNALIKAAFRVFDRRGTGKLSSADLRSTIATMGIRVSDEELDEIMMEADTDNSGDIDEDEFLEVVKQWGAARLLGEMGPSSAAALAAAPSSP
eukprot:TRINITY_DN57811_c0_g1_i1.p1 TRINITY_DN57811_c0_g1~~TRINITY_DN57811_c0_g1_i1.p1  ORF type:complete len:177 (+),score=44.84 TRINITY_DN57811_c0_g1_i1:171-701(+)